MSKIPTTNLVHLSRELALRDAKLIGLQKHNERVKAFAPPKYPYVFDLLAERKQVQCKCTWFLCIHLKKNSLRSIATKLYNPCKYILVSCILWIISGVIIKWRILKFFIRVSKWFLKSEFWCRWTTLKIKCNKYNFYRILWYINS